MWGLFVFNIVFLLLSTSLSFFKFFFFCFVSIFMSKKIICFIFIFRGDRLSNGFAQKAPARVFLQKLQRRHGTTESNRHFFPFFWLFYIYLCIYMFIHILKLHFLPFYIGLLFFWVFYIFFLSLFLIEIMNQIKLKNKA